LVQIRNLPTLNFLHTISPGGQVEAAGDGVTGGGFTTSLQRSIPGQHPSAQHEPRQQSSARKPSGSNKSRNNTKRMVFSFALTLPEKASRKHRRAVDDRQRTDTKFG
jgi:hypothetical protein